MDDPRPVPARRDVPARPGTPGDDRRDDHLDGADAPRRASGAGAAGTQGTADNLGSAPAHGSAPERGSAPAHGSAPERGAAGTSRSAAEKPIPTDPPAAFLLKDPPPPERPGLRPLAWRFAWVAILLTLDLWSKDAAFVWLESLDDAGALVEDPCASPHLRRPLLGDWLTFMPSLNPGAAFGQLDQWPWLLVGGRVFAATFLVWLLSRTPRGKPWLVTAFVLVLAGALGNLYDNLFRARDLVLDFHYAHNRFMPVRDFIDVYFEAWHWHFPTFNVADSCITVGAILLLVTSFARRQPG